MYPTKRIQLNAESPIVQNMVIEYFRKHKIPVYSNTTEFDSEFPYLYWNGEELCQTKATIEECRSLGKEYLDIDDFMQYFDPTKITTVTLNSEYVAIVDGKNEIVKVGCQEIPFSRVEAVYNAIQTIKKNK